MTKFYTTIRITDRQLYEALKLRAAKERRSYKEEANHLLERSLIVELSEVRLMAEDAAGQNKQ